MAMRRWTEEEDARLSEYARQGMLARQVAKLMGRTSNSIRMRLRRNGETWAGLAFEDRKRAGGVVHGQQASAGREIRKARAIAMWHEGKSRKEIAEAMGLALSVINSYCSGLVRPKVRKPRAPAKPRPKLPPKRRVPKFEKIADAVRSYHAQGLEQAEVAAKLAVNTATVRRAAKFAGITRWIPLAVKPERSPEPRRLNYSRVGLPPVAKIEVPTIVAAAQYLGRWYRPVCRADIERPKGEPTHYRVGRQVLPVQDMFALAREKGFAA